MENLTRQRITTFLPLIEVTRRRGSRRIASLQPLFPGYVFVQMDHIDQNPYLWYTVRWTPGVRLILGGGDGPIPVPDEVVGAIQERVRPLGFVRPRLRFAPDDRVLIRHGPLAGLECLFDRPLSRDGRVQVLMNVLGDQRRVQLNVLDLECA